MTDIKKIAERLAKTPHDHLAASEKERLFESILREELEGESVTKIDQTCDKPTPLADAIWQSITDWAADPQGSAESVIQQVIDNHFKDVEGEVEKYLEFIDQYDFRTNSGHQLSDIVKDFLHHMINKEV